MKKSLPCCRRSSQPRLDLQLQARGGSAGARPFRRARSARARPTPSQPCRRLCFIEICGALQVFGMIVLQEDYGSSRVLSLDIHEINTIVSRTDPQSLIRRGARQTNHIPMHIPRHQRGHVTKVIRNTVQTRDTPSIARACMRQAAEWPAYSAAIAGNSLQALDPPASTCTHARHASMQMQCAQGHAGGTSCQHRRCRPDHRSATAQGGVFFISR